jgi:hypothetical protein
MNAANNVEVKTTESLQEALLLTLLYFDLFRYPLSSKEINDNCHLFITALPETEAALNDLLDKGIIGKEDNYYFIGNDNSIVKRRKEGNALADKTLVIAYRFSRLIASFPFVRGVYLSGSLSKGFMDKESDVDYFIITSPQRLWICRTLLVLFKKALLLNSKKYFCVNYFVDTNNIEIPDKNIFTATELAFIHPTYNYSLYEQCMEANSWIKEFYPNKKLRQNKNIAAENFLFKNGLEKMLKGKLGEKLEDWCFRLTLNHWQKKFKDFDKDQFDLHLRTKKNVSKHHPQGYQTKVLNAYQQKIKDFELTHNILLANRNEQEKK